MTSCSRRDVRHGLRLDRQDHDVLVQHLVVLHVRPHRERRRPFAAVEEDRRAGDAVERRIHCVQLVDERLAAAPPPPRALA